MFGKWIDQGLGSMTVALIAFGLLAAPAWADDGCDEDCVDGACCVNGVCTTCAGCAEGCDGNGPNACSTKSAADPNPCQGGTCDSQTKCNGCDCGVEPATPPICQCR
jgi:hypothetical protein